MHLFIQGVSHCKGTCQHIQIVSNVDTILVVDDDPRIRELLVCSFEAEQFSVLEADSSEGLYKILEKEKVDLITMDVVLERENGLDLVRDLRKLSEP